MVITYLRSLGIDVSSLAVDRAYMDGKPFVGLPVVAIEDIADDLDSYEVVCGGANYPRMTDRLESLGATTVHVIDVPDFLNIPKPFMDYGFFATNRQAFEEAAGLFADDLSRQTFAAAIQAKISEDPTGLLPVVRPDHLYFCKTEFPLGDDEVLLDVGAFNGDSVRDFHRATNGSFRKAIALEPFEESYRQLLATIDDLGLKNVEPIAKGAWNEPETLAFSRKELDIDNKITGEGDLKIDVDRIDSILAERDDPISLIKMDINGAEYRALCGAAETIRRFRPRVAVKMHVKEDFFRLPILLKSIAPDAKLFLRQRNFMSMMLMLYAQFDR